MHEGQEPNLFDNWADTSNHLSLDVTLPEQTSQKLGKVPTNDDRYLTKELFGRRRCTTGSAQ